MLSRLRVKGDLEVDDWTPLTSSWAAGLVHPGHHIPTLIMDTSKHAVSLVFLPFTRSVMTWPLDVLPGGMLKLASCDRLDVLFPCEPCPRDSHSSSRAPVFESKSSRRSRIIHGVFLVTDGQLPTCIRMH